MVDAKDDVSDVRNEIETSGYGLLNLRASHSWKTVRVDFGVENLFDKYYELPTGRRLHRAGYRPWGSTAYLGHCCSRHGTFDLRRGERELLSPVLRLRS